MIEKPNSSPRTSEIVDVMRFIMVITMYFVYLSVYPSKPDRSRHGRSSSVSSVTVCKWVKANLHGSVYGCTANTSLAFIILQNTAVDKSKNALQHPTCKRLRRRELRWKGNVQQPLHAPSSYVFYFSTPYSPLNSNRFASQNPRRIKQRIRIEFVFPKIIKLF